MLDTVEQRIVDSLVNLLQMVPFLVTASDGRAHDYAIAELPAANVFTPKSGAEDTGPAAMDHELQVNIVLHLADRTAQKAVRDMVSDIYAAIGEAEQNRDGPLGVPEVIKIDAPAKAVKCNQAGDFIGSAQIALTVTYRTARWAL